MRRAGNRVTLNVPVLAKGTSPGETAFRIEDGPSVAAFYWIEGDIG